jgi:ribosome-binding ATPase YchF (GTP1/OBG family)
MSFDDFKALGSEAAVKYSLDNLIGITDYEIQSLIFLFFLTDSPFSLLTHRAAGKLRTEGKTYTVQDGDIIYVKVHFSLL